MGKIKKNIALIGGTAALMACAASFGAISRPMAVMAEGEEESSEVIYSEASVESSEYPETSSETSKNAFEDKDGDGVPDAVEEYYDAHIRDQYMFGISLGALISFAVAALTEAFKAYRNGNFRKSVESIAVKTREIAEKEYDSNESFRKTVDELNGRYQALLKEYEEKCSKLEKVIEEYKDEMEAVSKTNAKLDAILSNTVLLTKSEEYVKNGVASKAEENAKEVE